MERMMKARLVPAVAQVRERLVRLAARSDPSRRAMARVGAELSRIALIGQVVREARAVDPHGGRTLYDGSYFGVGRDPSGDRGNRSGYATYDRVSSNADIAAFMLWRNFRAFRALDVGCAKGYLVEALRERGVEAFGCDVSRFAVENAAPGALGYVRLGDLGRGLPYVDGEFDLVTALEVLEHLEPSEVPGALSELRRVCRGVVYATIPSFGRNPSGPDGHLVGKVRPECLERYQAMGHQFEGPVPYEDLEVDAEGRPIEGHLTIASYDWWTARFAEAGFDRWADVERRLYEDIAPAGLGPFWNLYVFAVPEASLELARPRHPDKTLRELGLVHPLIEHAASLAAAAEG